MYRLTDTDITSNQSFSVFAQNPGGYWDALPVTRSSYDGSSETIAYSFSGYELQFYYRRHTADGQDIYTPSYDVPILYMIIQGP